MPKIPLYEQRVAPTTQIGGAEARGADLPYKALAGVGDTIAHTGMAFAEKLNKEESEAQVAGFYADRKRREKAMKQTLSTMQDPDEIESTYSRWVENEKATFNDSKLTSDARRAIGNNNKNFYADTDISTREYANKARINNIDKTYLDVMSMAALGETDETVVDENGNVLQPQQLYNYAIDKRVEIGTLSYEQGSKEKLRFTSASNNSYLNSKAAEIQLAKESGILAGNDYIEAQKALIKEAEELDMTTTARGQITTPATYKIANEMGNISREAKQFENDFRKTIIDGKLDPGWVEKAKLIYGDDIAVNMKTILENSLNRVAASNDEVKELMLMVDDLSKTPMTYGEIVKKASEKGGEYSEEIRELAAIIAGEFVDSNASLSYYKSVAKQVGGPFVIATTEEMVAPYNGWVADLHKEIIDTVNALPSETSSEGKAFRNSYREKVRSLIEFYNRGVTPTDEEIKDWGQKNLRKDLDYITSNLMLPQTKNKSGGFEVGKVYTDAGGNRARWNGESWEGVE